MPARKFYDKQITFNCTEDMQTKVQEYAAARGVTPAVVCRWALDTFFNIQDSAPLLSGVAETPAQESGSNEG